MIKFENTEVTGWEAAIRGMRNPMNSWEKSDSGIGCSVDFVDERPCVMTKKVVLGSNDLDLMVRLRNAGTDHRKFMRMIVVYVDITAPLYWWKEFDTYKVGTVANSCSTMHKIAVKEFTFDDFSHDHLLDDETIAVSSDGYKLSPMGLLGDIISMLNAYRDLYLQTKDKRYWWQMIQLLPSSYNQRRTVALNYEVLANIYKSRRNHKLDEWRRHEEIIDGNKTNKEYIGFCDWIEKLPHSELIITQEEKK